MFKQFKKLNELDSYTSQVENLQKENRKLTDELKEVKDELNQLKGDYGQFVGLFFESTQTLKNDINNLKNDVAEVPVMVIGETSIGENVLSYHLRTSPQTQSKNYRYYYKSNYLFTAPLNLKNILTIEFNRLMNGNLDFEEVISKLKSYKESLEHELSFGSIQTELGVILNE